MKPSLLKRLYNKLNTLKRKVSQLNIFEKKTELFKKESNFITHFTNIDNKFLNASYLAILTISIDGRPHTIDETLELQGLKNMVQTVLAEKKTKEFYKILLSNKSVKKIIDIIASNIEKVLVTQLKMCSNFSLQLDENINIRNIAQLLDFIWYDFHNVINEGYLFVIT